MKKLICCAASLVSALVLMAGCGEKKGSCEATASCAAAEVAKRPAVAAVPKAPVGTQAAFLYQKNSSPALAPFLTAAMDRFKEKVLADESERAKAFSTFLKDSGVLDGTVDWAFLPVVDPDTFDKSYAVTVALTHDAMRFGKALETYGAAEADATVVPKSVADETAWGISIKGLPDDGLCLASLDGKLFIAAASEEVLKSAVDLYRNGGKTEGAFDGIASDQESMAKIRINSLGSIIEKTAPAGDLASVDMFLPDGKAILCGLGAVEANLKGTGDKATLAISVVTRNAGDATTLATALNGGKAMAASSGDEAVRRLVKNLTIEAKDKVLSVNLVLSAEDVAELAKSFE